MYQKRKPYRNKKMMEGARDEECLVNFPGCQGSHGVVAAHSNLSQDGKGTGLKADDCASAYACKWCHDILDMQGGEWKKYKKLEREAAHDRGIVRTMRRRIDQGIEF